MEKRRNCSLGAISPLFHNIFYMLLDFHVRQRTDFHFEISGYSRERDSESQLYVHFAHA